MAETKVPNIREVRPIMQVRTTNGLVVEGDTEDWVGAILMVLPLQARQKVVQLVHEKMMTKHIKKRNHHDYVLNAEAGDFRMRLS